jgi:hemerythrin-like domain-containing protein
MPYHDELLAQAEELVHKDGNGPTQADLRRAVSAAYYALFHLLTGEASLNWSHEGSRGSFARMFDHGIMRKASQRVFDSRLSPFSGEDQTVVDHLKVVAQAFVQLQQKRHLADYDNAVFWAYRESEAEVVTARNAFQSWTAIRNENLAQSYLVSLLIRSRD